MVVNNPFQGNPNPGGLSDRELLVEVYLRADHLLSEVQRINGGISNFNSRLGLVERLSWIAIGGVGVLAFGVAVGLSVWAVINGT